MFQAARGLFFLGLLRLDAHRRRQLALVVEWLGLGIVEGEVLHERWVRSRWRIEQNY